MIGSIHVHLLLSELVFAPSSYPNYFTNLLNVFLILLYMVEDKQKLLQIF